MTWREIDAECAAQAAREMAKKGYVPYSKSAPKTTSISALRTELHRVREVYGRGSSQGLEAFNRLMRAESKTGPEERELQRFLSRTIPAPNGHVHWQGALAFHTVDKRHRHPARWWWEYVNGPIPNPTLRVYRTCTDKKCITPEHAILEGFQRSRFTEDEILDFIRIAASTVGRPPTTRDFNSMAFGVKAGAIGLRFGSWPNALERAGIDTRRVPVST